MGAMPNSFTRLSPRAIVLLALVVGTLAKLWLAGTSIGSNDLLVFRWFAQYIDSEGLAGMYRHTALFNHTPLTSAYMVGVLKLSGGEVSAFAFWFRFGGILADVTVVLGLLRVVRNGVQIPTWALALFAVSPVSIMVSGFHGNIDSMLVAALFFTVLALSEKRWLLAGLALALACNLKVSPLLVVPGLGLWALAQSPRGAAVFAGSAMVATLVGWSFPLMVCPKEFLTNVLGYGGFWGIWGFTSVLRDTGLPDFSRVSFINLTAAQVLVAKVLKGIVVVSTLGLAWVRRKQDVFATVGAVWLVFLVFAPGVAAQYLVWPAPFLLLLSARGFAFVTLGCSVFLAAFYTALCKGWPWILGVSNAETTPHWLPWTYVAWVPCVAWWVVGVTLCARRCRGSVASEKGAGWGTSAEMMGSK